MRLKIKVKTSLLVGGYSSKVFIDKVTARNPGGIPIIPASAIKGALRIELERILRAINEKKVCDSSSPDSMCQDEKELCMACTLFGGIYNEGKLRFPDAKIEDENWQKFFEKGGYTSRAGIGVSRGIGTVKENLLFDKEIIEPFAEDEQGKNIEFHANVEVLAQGLTLNEIKYLNAAVKALDAIGGEKSRGLGWVEVVLEDVETSSKGTPSESSALTSDTILVKVIPREPIRTSFTKTTSYFYETLGYIPGSALRGAIAKCISKTKGCDCDTFINTFLKTPVIFSNLYPVGRDITKREPPKPIPLSARTCKTYPGFEILDKPEEKIHGYKDILIMDFLTKLFFEELGIFIPLKEGCEYCLKEKRESGLKELLGYYISPVLQAEEPPRQVMTRIAINRKLNTTKEGVLYSYEAIEPIFKDGKIKEVIFAGLIKISEDSVEFKENLAKIREIKLGGRRNVGFGKVEIRFEDFTPDSENELRGRLTALNEKIGELGLSLLKILGIEAHSLEDRFEKRKEGKLSEADEFYFTVTLTSDFIPPEPDFKGFLEKTLGDEVRLRGCFINTHRVGGWNDAIKRQKDLCLAISKGSALIFSIPSAELNNLLDKIVNLQQTGIGLRNFEGFGQFSFCDEIHYRKVF